MSVGVLVDSRGQWRGYVILFNCRRLAFDVPRLRGSVGGKRKAKRWGGHLVEGRERER